MASGVIYSLDVLGNEKDGFDVNDMYSEWHQDVPFTESSDNQDILNWLNESYFKKPVKLEQVTISEWDDASLLISDKKTGRPLVVVELPTIENK